MNRSHEHQPNIFEFTPETGQTEWNLAHHLAVELCSFFPFLDHDLDVTKRNYGDKRPDIIFHKRGRHESNYLVLELKRDGNPREIETDIEKIHAYWFQGKLNYQFGALVDLRSDGGHQVQVFKNAG
jgi:hypothetical protein